MEDIHEMLYQPGPNPRSSLIEQFDGFFELEDCRPSDWSCGLQDGSEYWGWPNGVAVYTQVSKQPDVVQLFAGATATSISTSRRANYDYYEPRCAHGSSLSHSVHGLVATRLGHTEQAYHHFMRTATVDLLSTAKAVVGGTFDRRDTHRSPAAAPIRRAVFGFRGIERSPDGEPTVNPHLPSHWQSIEYGVRFVGQSLRVLARHDATIITASPENTGAVRVRQDGGGVATVGPGDEVSFHRRVGEH